MKRKSSMFALCDDDQTTINRLVCASDKERKNQSIVCNMLNCVFTGPDVSKDQDHFLNTVFVNTKWTNVLFLYPDLN